jgi:hypothetical protein
MTLMRISFLGLVIMLWFTSCTDQQDGQQNQGITESNALERAKAEFANTGCKIGDYAVTIETDSTGPKWIVWFDRKGPYAKLGKQACCHH